MVLRFSRATAFDNFATERPRRTDRAIETRFVTRDEILRSAIFVKFTAREFRHATLRCS